MTEAEAWEASRGIWKFNADRALAQDEVQIVNTEGTVLALARITGISKHGDRYALEGEVLRGDSRVGQPTPWPHLAGCCRCGRGRIPSVQSWTVRPLQVPDPATRCRLR
ncbi:hypothetical protein ACFWFZ_03780 [Streptomyces sp. NPDC060232]|uniref:hypothetical protein n=1 Tax=Streptomyces sp. NPDC060232 TaxID=3347079 RepID=UPI003657A143